MVTAEARRAGRGGGAGRARRPHATVAVGKCCRRWTLRVTREHLVRYAGASGDFNPIHWSDRVAIEVGLPGVIAHGMLTMALAGRLVTAWTGDPAAVVGYGTRFTRPVVVPDDAKGVALELTDTGEGRRRPAGGRPRRRSHRLGADHGDGGREGRAGPRHGPGPLPSTDRASPAQNGLTEVCPAKPGAGAPERPRRLGEASMSAPHSLDARAQVVVAQRVGEAEEARRAERLAGDDRHLGVLEDRAARRPGRGGAGHAAAPSRAGTDG